jgi:predicted HTH transcriptional regulator
MNAKSNGTKLWPAQCEPVKASNEFAEPGGMYSGQIVQEQDVEKIKSEHRNPVIADTLGMTKRNVENSMSGLKRIGIVERDDARKNGCWVVRLPG